MNTLQTGALLLMILGVIGGYSAWTGALNQNVSNPTARACTDAIHSAEAQISAATVQNPNMVTALENVHGVTHTIAVTQYNQTGKTTTPQSINVPILANATGQTLTLTATMPNGSTCSSNLELASLSLPSNTTTTVNTSQQGHE
jgi:hypothetical protein